MSKPFIIVLAVTSAVCLAVGIPNFIRARSQSSAAPCVNTLRVIDAAKHQWALEAHKTTADMPTWADLRPFLPDSWTNSLWKNGKVNCPAGGTFTIGRVGKSPSCSMGGDLHTVPQ